MPPAHFLGLCPGLVLAQHPDDLLLAEATPFHRPSPFQATDSTSFRLSFRGAGQFHHALDDLSVESETSLCFVSLFAFPDRLWANVRSMRSRSGARCPRGAAMPSEVLRELILELTEPDRLEIIREAGIRDDRPSLLRGDAQDGPPEEADSWVTQNGAKILPHLLRRIDPSDDEMVQLVQSGMLPFDRSLLKPRKFLVRFNHPAMRGALDGGLPLSEVAATSLALTELITSLLAANRSFGADAVMPTVRVAAGSVDFFATGAGLIVGGLSLLATCGVGVISAPVTAGTAVLTGAIDLTLNWQKRSSEKGRSDAERAKADAERARADAERARADAKKIEAETIGQELENEMKRVRLGNLPAQVETHPAEKPETPPASFFVPFALIERSSRENGLAAAHGVHLINRGLPSLFAILRVMPGLLITVENIARQ